MLLILLLAAALGAQPLPGGAALAAKAKAPPKRVKVEKEEKKEPAVAPPAFGGSGYDYFHLMAAPDMAGRPAVITTRKARRSPPELRDAVASPKPAAPAP